MKPLPVIQTQLHRILAPALIAGLTACAPYTLQFFIDPGATPTAATADPLLTATGTFEGATPSATATLTPPPAGGDWLLVNTERGLWMSRPDGSEAGIRIPGPLFVPVPLSDALSPAGGLLAYLTFVSSRKGCADPVLNIVSPTGGKPADVIPLTSPETACTDNLPNAVLQAVTGQFPLAWSPDGGRLAFIGAQQGPSADLYEYFRGDGRIVRLTDGPDQAYRPQWSPDGRWIVQAAADSFGSGAGFGVTGFYAARADDGGVISLYDVPERSGDEVGIGWLDGHTLVAHSWFADCGPQDLRLADLSVPKADLVFEGCLTAVTAGGGSVLFAQSSVTARGNQTPRPGLYLIQAADRAPRQLSGDNIHYLAWAEGIGAFLANTWDNRLLEISPAGEIRGLSAGGAYLPVVAPGGRYWAYPYNAPGIFVGEYGRDPVQIFTGEIAWNGMLFSPGGETLHFLTAAGELYRASAPEWTAVKLAEGLAPASTSLSMAWLLDDTRVF